MILDDILLSPLHGLVWLARQLESYAREQTGQSLTPGQRLADLTMCFELGEISEEAYDAERAVIVDEMRRPGGRGGFG